MLLVSTAYELLFLRHGISLVDEGWALYAALAVQRGRTLYQDVLWVFPPGHLLAAWTGLAVDPPGILVARAIYSAFTVAASGSIYLLATRLMPGRFALAAGLLVALAAPQSHQVHVVFGYRYLVFSALALVVYDRRLRGGKASTMGVVGGLLGLGALFRLGPSFAAAVGIGLTVLAASTSPRRWLREWAWLALGLGLTLGLGVLYLSSQVGLETLWRETVLRPARMLALQSTPWPPLSLPAGWSRESLSGVFVALEFRLIWILYAAYGLMLGASLVRSRLRGERFAQPLLLAVVLWGAVFFTRSLTRSDVAHLDSAIPPVCLLVAHAASRLWRIGVERLRVRGPLAHAAEWGIVTALVAAWAVLNGTDLRLSPERRGLHRIQATGGSISVPRPEIAEWVDTAVSRLRSTPPKSIVLDLTVSPLLYVLSDRLGPGRFDIVMRGTFLDAREEEEFVARLERSPPRMVILPERVAETLPPVAPRLWDWLERRALAEGRVPAARSSP